MEACDLKSCCSARTISSLLLGMTAAVGPAGGGKRHDMVGETNCRCSMQMQHADASEVRARRLYGAGWLEALCFRRSGTSCLSIEAEGGARQIPATSLTPSHRMETEQKSQMP